MHIGVSHNGPQLCMDELHVDLLDFPLVYQGELPQAAGDIQ